MATARRLEPRPSGFDFTLHMRRLCEDLTDRLPELRHIDLSRVAIGFSQTRKRTSHGMYASLTPLRFVGGAVETVRRGRRWTIQRLYSPSGREMLYILGFYLPRFCQIDFHEKLTTVVHELWHISPDFDGDVRRYGGRCYVHTKSGDHDRQAERLAQAWLAQRPPESLYAFLQLRFQELQQRHGTVVGQRVPVPKLVPLD